MPCLKAYAGILHRPGILYAAGSSNIPEENGRRSTRICESLPGQLVSEAEEQSVDDMDNGLQPD